MAGSLHQLQSLSFPEGQACFSYYPLVQLIHVVDLVTGVLGTIPEDIQVQYILIEIVCQKLTAVKLL
jgi:hypothetical protein